MDNGISLKNKGSNMKTKYSMFSDMLWLDNEIKRNQESPGRNPMSDYYYNILLSIRTAQENKTITDDLYSKFGSLNGASTPEEGYYCSNIHYDLYKNSNDIENTEDRIIHFLQVSNPFIIKNSSSIRNSLLHDLCFFIKDKINAIDLEANDNVSYIKKYGTSIECEIVDKLLELTNMDRPIIYQIKVNKYNQIIRVLESLVINFNAIEFNKIPLGNDGRIFKKKGSYKMKSIDIEKTDGLFDSIYKIIANCQSNTLRQRKEYAECLEFEIITDNGLKKFMFIDEKMDDVIEKIATLLSKYFDEYCYLDFLKGKEMLIEA